MRKLLFLTLLAIMLLPLVASPASAILNVKEYDQSSKSILIKDWLGLSDYVKVQMTYNTEQCISDECMTEFDITPAQDLQPKDILDNLKFYDKGGYNNIQGKVNYQILVQEPKTIIVKEDVFGTCQTENHSTYDCKTGTKDVEHIENDYVNFYDYDTFKAKITYRIILKGSKPVNSAVDWVFDIGGIETKELAWWSSNWTYVKTMTVTNTETFNHTKEVAIIRFNSTDIISHSKSDFTDIRVLNQSNSLTPYQLVRYGTNVTADAVAFLINIINGSSIQTYSLYYGNAAASDASTTLFDKYDFFENASYVYDQSSTKSLFNTQDTVAKINANTTVIKSPSGTTSIQSLQVNRGDGSVVNNIGGLLKPFTISWWQNPAGSYSAEGGTGGVTNRYGMYIDASGNIYAMTAGDGVWTDTGVDMTSLDNWAWFKIVVNATGEFYFRGNQSGVFKIAQDLNAAEDFVGFTLGHISGGSIGNSTFDNAIFANSALVWNEYYIPSKISLGAETTNTAPATVQLVSPTDGTKTRNTTLDFTCIGSANTGNTVRNMTFWLYKSDGSIYTNFTDISALSLNNFTDVTTYAGLTEGNSSWNCLMCETQNTSYAAGNFSFLADYTAPRITINNPTYGATYYSWNNPYQRTFNVTVSDSATAVDSCWLYNGTTNISFTCASNITTQIYSGAKTIVIYVNDTLNNVNSSSIYFVTNFVNETAVYNPTAYEGDAQSFVLNIQSTGIVNITGNLTYNSVVHSTTPAIASSTAASLSHSITVPLVSSNTNFIFNWTYMLNGISHSIANYNQTVYDITSLTFNTSTCPTGLSPSMNFSFYEETNLTDVTGLTVQAVITYGLSNSSTFTSNATLTNVNNVLVCINSTLFNNYSVNYGELQYSKLGYANRRYYMFRDVILSNITQFKKVYNLPDDLSNAFSFTLVDTQSIPFVNKYVSLMRWYPNLNSYYAVDMGKTDDSGKTIMSLQLQSVDYRIAIYELSGSLIYLANPVRMYCPTVPCTYTQQVVTSNTNAYLNEWNLQDDLTYDSSTEVFTYVWNDPSQTTNTMNLKVSKLVGDRDYFVCNTLGSGSTGVLACNTSGIDGMFTANVYRISSPAAAVATLSADKSTSIFDTPIGLVITFLIMLPIIFAGIAGGPYGILIMSLISLIPALILHTIPALVFFGFAIMIAVAIHLVRRSGG